MSVIGVSWGSGRALDGGGGWGWVEGTVEGAVVDAIGGMGSEDMRLITWGRNCCELLC